MSKVMIVGSGRLANVALRACCEQPEIFTEICIAGRTKSRCDALKKELSNCGPKIITAAFDATNAEKTALTVKIFRPDLIINLAPPHVNLNIMELCLKAKASYVDASYYRPKRSVSWAISEQLKYSDRFAKSGLTALVGCGFNPGVTAICIEHARQNLFDRIQSIDIIDAHAGNTGHPYLTNAQIGKSIRELSSPARYYEKEKWLSTEPLEQHISLSFPEVGRIQGYRMDHEVVDRLPAVVSGLEKLQYFGAYRKPFLNLFYTLSSLGLTATDPISIENCLIPPIDFLDEVLPKPRDLAASTTGKTGIGCIMAGESKGQKKTCMMYAAADHTQCYEQMKSSADDFLAGIPVAIGATMILDGTFCTPGAFTAESLPPAEFIRRMNQAGIVVKTVKAPAIKVQEEGGKSSS